MTNKKKLKKDSDVREIYGDILNYIVDSKKYIYSIIVIFFASALIGFFVPLPDSVLEKLFDYIRDILAKTEGLSTWGLIEFIFLNNVQGSFFGMAFGIFFGLFPVVAAILNGFVLGIVSSMSVQVGGIFSLWRLFPHGIFELPAIFISLGLGVRIGTYLFNGDSKKGFMYHLKNSLKVFFFVVVPLLIVAAIIEGVLISWTR